jgi:hypothetical protein
VQKTCSWWAALLLVLICAACSDKNFVERIVIDNSTEYSANVDVTGGARDGWLPLTTADAHETTAVGDVYDQGSTWIFRFSYLDYEEEIRLTRAELARSEWHVNVPDSFAAELRDRGVLPPP